MSAGRPSFGYKTEAQNNFALAIMSYLKAEKQESQKLVEDLKTATKAFYMELDSKYSKLYNDYLDIVKKRIRDHWENRISKIDPTKTGSEVYFSHLDQNGDFLKLEILPYQEAVKAREQQINSLCEKKFQKHTYQTPENKDEFLDNFLKVMVADLIKDNTSEVSKSPLALIKKISSDRELANASKAIKEISNKKQEEEALKFYQLRAQSVIKDHENESKSKSTPFAEKIKSLDEILKQELYDVKSQIRERESKVLFVLSKETDRNITPEMKFQKQQQENLAEELKALPKRSDIIPDTFLEELRIMQQNRSQSAQK